MGACQELDSDYVVCDVALLDQPRASCDCYLEGLVASTTLTLQVVLGPGQAFAKVLTLDSLYDFNQPQTAIWQTGRLNR